MTAAAEKIRRLGEPRFVGREHELRLLQEELELSRQGRERLLFVEAPSGRGKTRLLNELIDRSKKKVLILEGQGTNQSAQRPFQILVGPAQQLVAAAQANEELFEALRRETEPWASVLCTILPELEALYPREAVVPLNAGELKEDRTLRALVKLLAALGRPSQPALLMLDDCQWADELTLKLIAAWQRFRGRENVHSCLVVLAAFRSEEVAEQHPLRAITPDRHFRLQDLGDDVLRSMLQSMAGELPEEAIRLVSRLSGGSPFIATTVLRGLAELGILRAEQTGWYFNGEAASQEFSEADHAGVFLKRRIELLRPETIDLLKVAAILGKEFEPQMALTIAGAQPGGFEEAQHRHIVRPLSSGSRFTFAHDKLRETMLSMLAPEERRLYCLRIGSTFEEERGGRCFDLAYFFDAAGDASRAFPYALQAAQEAARASPQIAEQQYRIALKGLSSARQRERYSLFSGFGEILMLRGKYDEAQDYFEKALALAKDEVEAAHVQARICETIFKMGSTDQARVALEKGLTQLGIRLPHSEGMALFKAGCGSAVQVLHTMLPALFLRRRRLQGAEKHIIICRLLNQLSYVYWYDEGSLFRAFFTHLTSLNLAERYSPTVELVHALSSHGPGMTALGCFEQGLRYCKRAVRTAVEIESIWGQGQAHNFWGCTALAASRFAECIEHCSEAAELLERAGDLWELDIANCNIGYGLYRAGNLPEAARISERTYYESMEAHDPTAAASSLSCWAKASAGNVPYEELARLRGMLPPSAYQAHVEAGTSEAVYWASGGELDRAISVLEEQWQRLRRKMFPQEYVLPVLPWLVTVLRLRLERGPQASARERAQMLRRARRLVRPARRTAAFFRNNLPQVLRETALLFLLEGQHERAVRSARKSVAAARAIHARYEEAQSLYALARIERARGAEIWTDTLAAAEALLAELGAAAVFFRLEQPVFID